MGACAEFGFPSNPCALNINMYLPFRFEGVPTAGGCRLPGTRGFQKYVGGRYYHPTWFSVLDEAAYAIAEQAFGMPVQFPGPIAGGIANSSYINSPAALVHPGVFRRPSQGGFRHPNQNFPDSYEGAEPIWSSYIFSPAAMYDPAVFSRQTGFKHPDTLASGYTSPPLAAAAYPSLKSHMIERNAIENSWDPCALSPAGCEPHHFNQVYEARPLALMHDGSVRLLTPRHAMVSDQRVRFAAGGGTLAQNGLSIRDTPFGSNGVGPVPIRRFPRRDELPLSHRRRHLRARHRRLNPIAGPGRVRYGSGRLVGPRPRWSAVECRERRGLA